MRSLCCPLVSSLSAVALIATLSLAKDDLDTRHWDAPSDEELAATSPRIDPNAGAEFLLREVRIDDDGEDTSFTYHNRAKIFTEAGVLQWDKVDLIYQTGWRIYGIRGRVIYPDGSVAELDRGDIFKRQIYKDEKFQGNAKSFSFPGLRPGCIVEYKWSETRAYWTPSLYIPVRAEWPTWKMSVTIIPYSGMAWYASFYHFNSEFEHRAGRLSLEALNQPARSEKPFLPPRKDFEPWIHLAYASDLKYLMPENYWAYRGGALVEINKKYVRAKQRAVQDLADEIFAGLSTGEEKLKAAYAHCANEIANVSFYTTRFTEEEIEKLKENKSPKHTIRNGYGTRYDINALFASLANVAGYDAMMTMVENHSDFSFRQNWVGEFNLSDWIVSLADGPKRRYFDPGSSFLPFEHLNPQNAGANAMVTDDKYYYMITTDPVDIDHSVIKRIAKVALDERGDLEGELSFLYTGYEALWRKRAFVSLAPKEREDYILQNLWQARLPRASLSELEFKHDDSRENKLVVKYRIRLPGYADVLGNRMLINPSLFEIGKSPPFTDEQRVEPITFEYPFRVRDKIEISVPEGFQVESVNPVALNVDVGAVKRRSRGSFDAETSTLTYERLYEQELRFLGYTQYPPLKLAFDRINDADAQPLSLLHSSELASASQP